MSTTAADAAVMLITPREHDVLDGLARGLPNKTIAWDLGIAPRSVGPHRANLMMKLAVRSLFDALRISFAVGLGVCPTARASERRCSAAFSPII